MFLAVRHVRPDLKGRGPSVREIFGTPTDAHTVDDQTQHGNTT